MDVAALDPPPTSVFSSFDNGLETDSGRPKPAYDAYRLPLYIPTTSLSPSAKVEVWGAARPAPFIAYDGTRPQTASLQLNDTTIATVNVAGPGGYFDLHMTLPTSGNLRLAYTYPSSDPLLPVGLAGTTVYSRTIIITVR